MLKVVKRVEGSDYLWESGFIDLIISKLEYTKLGTFSSRGQAEQSFELISDWNHDIKNNPVILIEDDFTIDDCYPGAYSFDYRSGSPEVLHYFRELNSGRLNGTSDTWNAVMAVARPLFR